MAWERRQRGGLYYYRSVRIEGQPRKVYLGKGADAQIQAKEDVERKARAKADRDACQAEQGTVAGVDRAMIDLMGLNQVLRNAFLILSGFHDHHGEWRHRNGQSC
jgi:hypothetical protein